ncbi:MAG TPA: hypothetical protein VHB70_11085 [Parafilimonas sp.]|nr:hypothetical protein [Parafilimonas sp.]
MALYQRIQGGERNQNTGKRWSEDELKAVLELFLQDPNLKIHENNPELHLLSQKLHRTVRSIEAQLLMFRNLSKHGDYSYGNMNSLCRKLWKEHLDSYKK